MATTKQSVDAPKKKAPKKVIEKTISESTETTPIIQLLDVSSIHPDPDNPRKNFNESEMNELIESVLEKGVLQPIIVRPVGKGYEIVAGERRWRAAAAVSVGFKDRNTIPAIIRTLSNKEVKEIQLVENIQRSEMHPMEEAEAFQDLKERNLSPEEIGAKVGKSVYYVRQRLKLNSLDESWANAYKSGHLSHKDALQLAQLNPDDQLGLYEAEYRDGPFKLNAWDLSRLQRKLGDARFDTAKDYDGLPLCSNCQFNTGSSSLFPDDEKNAFCKNRKCFEMKEAYEFDEILESKKDDPNVVLVAPSYDLEESLKESWKANGLQVYKQYDFNELQEPMESDFDLDLEYYDDGENDEEYKEELGRYQEAVEEYQKDLKRPDLVKALVMAGGDKGRILIGYMDANPNLIDQNNASGDKGTSDAPKSIKDEIARIKSKEERSKELDGEKVWAKIVSLLDDPENRSKVFNDGKLTSNELFAAGYALCQKMGFQHNSWIREFFGDTTDKYTYEVPDTITSKMLCGILRMFVCDALVTNYGSHLKKNSQAAIAFPILEKYLPKEIALFEIEQQEISEKRQEKVNKRIADLKKKEV